MAFVRPLPPEALYTRCTLDHVDFTTTADLEDGIEFIGQERPIAAIELGVTIARQGYNIFALGPSGTGKYTVIERFVEQRAAAEPPPDDWCYVNDFEQPSMPRALRLPDRHGQGAAARHASGWWRSCAPASRRPSRASEYATRRRALEEEFQERQQESLEELQQRARERGLTLLRTPSGLAFAADEGRRGRAARGVPEAARGGAEAHRGRDGGPAGAASEGAAAACRAGSASSAPACAS